MDNNRRTISQREKILLIIVGIMALVAAFYFFIYQRQIDEMASIRSKLSENNRKLEEVKSFTAELKDIERDVDALDVQIRDATIDWFPSLKQDIIIKDLDSKLSRTWLQDTSVEFISSEVASIGKLKDGETPRLADVLTLAFVNLMQNDLENNGDQNNASITETAEGLIEKAADALAVATPTPGPDNDEMTTAFGAQAGAGSGVQRSSHGELTEELQTKYDKLKEDLTGLTDAEMKSKLSELLGDVDGQAKVEKVVVNVSFRHSRYDSIIDFMKMIEASSPNIYVESVEFVDHTDDYLNNLQAELEYKEKKYTDEQNALIKQENQRRQKAYEDEVYRVALENNSIEEYNNNLTIDSINEYNQKVENKEVSVDELFDINAIEGFRDFIEQPISPEYLKDVSPRTIIKSYTGANKYDGKITLSYFAISKIHRQ